MIDNCGFSGSDLPTLIFFGVSTFVALLAAVYALAIRPRLEAPLRGRLRVPIHAAAGVLPFVFFWILLYCGDLSGYSLGVIIRMFGLIPPGGLYSLALALSLLGLLLPERFEGIQRITLLSYLPVLALANLFVYAISQG